MTEIYQPVIIRYLLLQGGVATKKELARVLSGYDDSVQEYYQKILMRWPKSILTKHQVVVYRPANKTFKLNFDIQDQALTDEAAIICEQKIIEWTNKRQFNGKPAPAASSKRYRVLKASGGKCELCGISAKVSPIDVDHIVPRNRADKRGRVLIENSWVPVDDEKNLQALCFRCNRAKRDTDTTDFRSPRTKLVRDRIPELIARAGGVSRVDILQGALLKEKLFEKLVEEHAELIMDKNLEEIVDMIEVLLAIAASLGHSEDETLQYLSEKRSQKGAFVYGLLLFEEP